MRLHPLFCLLLSVLLLNRLQAQSAYTEPNRPQVHFSPQKGWMNDPNGMVYHAGTYHLFYQYYPDSTVWGPMHWGHATSQDLLHWQHQPVALKPDSLGYIFSGSAVVDERNTSGLGRQGKAPLVAIFTHHDPKAEKGGRKDFQVQSLAYSVDSGRSWQSYAGNPVLRNPGIADFRDPKVQWHVPSRKWVMTLATKDRITFYTAPDLKQWTKASEFGAGIGAHGGVWECPDLFTLTYAGKPHWVLLVNLNPGGPNGGSATQYFVGSFDGQQFKPYDTLTRWADFGPDEYAGITWSNTGNRRIFLGWMSNWNYAQVVPTSAWRSALTLPRDLALEQSGGRLYLRMRPVPELAKITGSARQVTAAPEVVLAAGANALPCRIDIEAARLQELSVTLSNSNGETVVAGYDAASKRYYLDRSRSGDTAFHKGFGGRFFAPRMHAAVGSKLTLLVDVSSVELFADDGLSVLTGIFFPTTPFNKVTFRKGAGTEVKRLSWAPLQPVWQR